MNSSNTFANHNLNGELNGDLNRNSGRGNALPTPTASPRRTAIFSALAALALAGGLIVSPSLANAATGLPVTGTDLTSVMFALGLITLGAGSVIALATRRREESSIP